MLGLLFWFILRVLNQWSYIMTEVKQCVQDELNELVERKDKLAVFLTKDKPSDIDVDCYTDSYILWLSMLKC